MGPKLKKPGPFFDCSYQRYFPLYNAIVQIQSMRWKKIKATFRNVLKCYKVAHKWAIFQFRQVKVHFYDYLGSPETPLVCEKFINLVNQILNFSKLKILEGLKNMSLR